MIKDIVQGAVKAAGGWVGSLIGGEPGRVVGSKLAGSLMEKLPGDDSGFEPISTVVQPQRFGGRMGFARPGMSKSSSVGMACLLYTSPSPRDVEESRMPSSA